MVWRNSAEISLLSLQKSSQAELGAKYLVKPLPHHLAGDEDMSRVGWSLHGVVSTEGHKVDVTLCWGGGCPRLGAGGEGAKVGVSGICFRLGFSGTQLFLISHRKFKTGGKIKSRERPGCYILQATRSSGLLGVPGRLQRHARPSLRLLGQQTLGVFRGFGPPSLPSSEAEHSVQGPLRVGELPAVPALSGSCELSSVALAERVLSSRVLSSRRTGSGLAARCCCSLSSE